MLKIITLLLVLSSIMQVDAQNLVIDINNRHQQMEGFGGALTWHCDRITKSSKKNEIADILFKDLGLDILRLKNWYYPLNYPSNKSTANMEVDWFIYHFDASNQLYALAKSKNPEIDVLLSCWGPPSSLKSNGKLNEGTLAKDTNGFRYGDYASYWVDILDHISFTPDYISLQNEPGYENSGWTTCAWRPEESSDFPAYSIAFDSVYNRISTREKLPLLIAPEAENIGQASWNSSINTFESLASTIKDNSNVYAYAYHLYNFYSTPNSVNTSLLNIIKNDFANKPAFMTEFSSNNYGWLETANMIQLNLIEANASAYIYWELMWNQDSDNAMLQVDDNGNYTIMPNYYAIKHFARYIDKGYTRVDVSGSTSSVKATAFINPTEEQLTLVITNTASSDKPIDLDYGNFLVNSILAYQTTENNFFKRVLNIAPDQKQFTLPKKSVSTFVFSKNELVSIKPTEKQVKNMLRIYPNPSVDIVYLPSLQKWTLLNSEGKILRTGESMAINIVDFPNGLYFVKTEYAVGKFIKK